MDPFMLADTLWACFQDATKAPALFVHLAGLPCSTEGISGLHHWEGSAC